MGKTAVGNEAVNQPGAVAAAVCISVVAVGGFLILPLFVGAAAGAMGLSERQVGFLAAGVMSGSALSSILAIFWIRKVDWRVAGYCAMGLLLAAHACSLFVDNFVVFTLCQMLAGLGGGAAYSLALTALSDNKHPDRCFGYSIAAQVTFQVVGLLCLPAIIDRSGLNGLLSSLVTLELCGLVLVRFFPHAGLAIERLPIGRALFKPRVLAALAGCFLFFFNIGAVWTYIERMGLAAQFDPGLIGRSLALGVSCGVPGALLAAWVGNRFGRLTPLSVGTLLTVAALAVLAGDLSPGTYVIALALYNFAWNFSLAFQYAVVNAVDASGRSVAAAPAFHGAGGAAGPAVTALVLTTGSLLPVNVLAGSAVLASLLLFALALYGLAPSGGHGILEDTQRG